MKTLIVFSIVIMIGCNGVFASNRNGQSIQNDDWSGIKQKTYSLSSDSVNAVLKVIQYSKAIIKYELTIVTSKTKIDQKGFALNLGSEPNWGIEYEQIGHEKEQKVIPYHSYLCSCGDRIDFEFRISKNLDKISIFASRKLRHDLFTDTIKEHEKLEDSVPLFLGYLYLKK